MIINIYGSTGEIGKKTLDLINRSFPKIKVNLLCAGSNENLLIKQIKIYKPKYVYLNKNFDLSKSHKKNFSKTTKILSYDKLCDYLNKSKSDLSILAISGYKSLYYLENIIKNTKNLGLVSKEAIVSAGHLFKKNKYFQKTNIFPLDSEHYSIYEFFDNSLTGNKNLKKIILTASGGPFYKKKYKDLINVSFNKAIKHPKWKMGYKNSIDSATLVNKCLEVIEAHYLFNIPYKNIGLKIHPQAKVHSIVIKNNYITNFNSFKNDMSVPILNFLMISNKKLKKNIHNLELNLNENLEFSDVNFNIFPIYKFFLKLDKSKPANLIKFNVGNEFAVNLFKNKLIKYTDIYKIIRKVVSLNLNSPLNSIKDVINYHEKIEKKIKIYFQNIL